MLWISLASFIAGAVIGQMRSPLLLVMACFISVVFSVGFAIASGHSLGVIALFAFGDLIVCQIAFVVSACFPIPRLRQSRCDALVRRRLT